MCDFLEETQGVVWLEHESGCQTKKDTKRRRKGETFDKEKKREKEREEEKKGVWRGVWRGVKKEERRKGNVGGGDNNKNCCSPLGFGESFETHIKKSIGFL